MTKQTEALAEQPALTATYTCGVCGVSMQMEQPAQQQEPVACAQIVSLNDMQGVVDWLPHNGAHLKAGDYLYTSPPAQRQSRSDVKPLTDEQIEIIWSDVDGSEGVLMRLARAIEAKLKEKNQ